MRKSILISLLLILFFTYACTSSNDVPVAPAAVVAESNTYRGLIVEPIPGANLDPTDGTWIQGGRVKGQPRIEIYNNQEIPWYRILDETSVTHDWIDVNPRLGIYARNFHQPFEFKRQMAIAFAEEDAKGLARGTLFAFDESTQMMYSRYLGRPLGAIIKQEGFTPRVIKAFYDAEVLNLGMYKAGGVITDRGTNNILLNELTGVVSYADLETSILPGELKFPVDDISFAVELRMSHNHAWKYYPLDSSIPGPKPPLDFEDALRSVGIDPNLETLMTDASIPSKVLPTTAIDPAAEVVWYIKTDTELKPVAMPSSASAENADDMLLALRKAGITDPQITTAKPTRVSFANTSLVVIGLAIDIVGYEILEMSYGEQPIEPMTDDVSMQWKPATNDDVWQSLMNGGYRVGHMFRRYLSPNIYSYWDKISNRYSIGLPSCVPVMLNDLNPNLSLLNDAARKQVYAGQFCPAEAFTGELLNINNPTKLVFISNTGQEIWYSFESVSGMPQFVRDPGSPTSVTFSIPVTQAIDPIAITCFGTVDTNFDKYVMLFQPACQPK